MKRIVKLVVAGVALALSACTTGQLNVTPPLQFTPVSAVLQMSVGTVNFAGAAVGLNVFETDRAPSGFTAIPVNTATLTGPGGFAGTAGSADPGSGSASVPLGSALNAFPLASGSTIFASADGYGMGPPGSSSSAKSPFPVQPQFFDGVPGASTAFSGPRSLYGSPPAYPAASGSAGYPEGFYLLALSSAPPTGVYTLTVNYTQNGNPYGQTASATLSSNATLATLPSPSYVSSAAGGGSGTITVPAGVTEVLINFSDRCPAAPPFPAGCAAANAIRARATALIHGAGLQGYVIPNSAGFATGDRIRVQAFGFDYNAFELGPPTNLSQTPPMPAQADVTVAAQAQFIE